MEKSLKHLRIARELFDLPPFSEDAEKVYLAVLRGYTDEIVYQALMLCIQSQSKFPAPSEVIEATRFFK